MQTNTFTRWSRCIAGAGLALVAASVLAQGSTVPTGASPDLVQDTQRWIESTVAAAESANTGVPLKMEVQVGALDSRLRLSPCARVEPYLPVGTRLWGRSRIGLRCLEGVTRWNVFLPVTVKAVGRAWVLRSNVNAGAVLTSADAVEAEVDWAEEASPAPPPCRPTGQW